MLTPTVVPSSLVVGIVIGTPNLSCASAESVAEYKLKAAYVRNFLKFTTFPEERSSLEVCIFGRSEIQESFAPLEGQKAGGKVISLVSNPAASHHCDLVFVSRDEIEKARSFLTGAQATLTVGETEDFNEKGGVVELFSESSRLRFRVNTEALRRVGLQMSSRLLDLAEITPGE